ncbi:MAG: hypothetical protein OSJ72_14785 [Lachnospiraceae bacterium]|nr:hypothetical protein [Lachnospiraceae bacterium]
MKNRTFQIIFYGFIISILLGFFYFFFGGQILNDLKAHRIEKSLSGMTLPADVELVEVSSFVGNTGNGNHVEILAGIFIHTDLDKDTVCSYFEDFEVLTVPDDLKYLDYIHFQSLNENDSAHGYYVIYQCYNAVTQMDLRGH